MCFLVIVFYFFLLHLLRKGEDADEVHGAIE